MCICKITVRPTTMNPQQQTEYIRNWLSTFTKEGLPENKTVTANRIANFICELTDNEHPVTFHGNSGFEFVFLVDKLREANSRFPRLETFFRDTNQTLFSNSCINLKHGYILVCVKSGVEMPTSIATIPPPLPSSADEVSLRVSSDKH